VTDRHARKMRQRTEWLWKHHYAQSNSLRVGYIVNKRTGNPRDVIAIRIHGRTSDIAYNMRLDEAASLAAGICKVITVQTLKGRIR